jgi:hypothetical protein
MKTTHDNINEHPLSRFLLEGRCAAAEKGKRRKCLLFQSKVEFRSKPSFRDPMTSYQFATHQ